jgi:hypothetical protein
MFSLQPDHPTGGPQAHATFLTRGATLPEILYQNNLHPIN